MLLTAVAQSHAEQTARADGIQSLQSLPHLVLRRIILGMQEHIHTLPRIGGKRDGKHEKNAHRRAADAEPQLAGAAHKHDRHPDEEHDDHAGEVVFKHDEQTHAHDDAERDEHTVLGGQHEVRAVVDLRLESVIIPGKHHHQCQFHQFGRLKADTRYDDPPSGNARRQSVDRGDDQKHHHDQKGRHRKMLKYPIVHEGDAEHHSQTDCRKQDLPLDVIVAVAVFM